MTKYVRGFSILALGIIVAGLFSALMLSGFILLLNNHAFGFLLIAAALLLVLAVVKGGRK